MAILKKLSKPDIYALSAFLLIALWLRVPFVSTGLPFFYHEDEAHHFNRVVNMVKSGSWNPDYFHKPSLHFYLRMPVVAASFLWGVKEGHLRRLEEIQTKDSYGVGNYAFTVSHEGIVKWNRTFSLLLSLAMLVMTYSLARRALGANSTLLPIAATLPAIFSPDLVGYSAYIGVDILMALLCIAAVDTALYVYSSFSLKGLFFCGLLCGLAISSKYNALPIALLPLFLVLCVRQSSCSSISIALLSPTLGFFIGSPFTLVSLPLFLNQFAYEIWHYGIEGHEGHMAEAGIPQLLFYLKWLANSALGFVFFAFACIGTIILLFKRDLQSKIFLLFPLLFTGLMCAQKANFERNMLVVVPFFGIAAVAGLIRVLKIFKLENERLGRILLILSLLFSLQPLLETFKVRSAAQVIPDSRRAAESYIEELSRKGEKVALAGQLQMRPRLYTLPEIHKIDQLKIFSNAAPDLSFDKYVLSGPISTNRADLILEREFKGNAGPQRVVKNPLIQVYTRKKGE